MLPMFILSFLPHGVIGFIFVAIMAALMSSLDSSLNSLSAVTMKDFYQWYIRPEADEKHYLIASKIITAILGIFLVTAALVFVGFGEAARQTTIVLTNAVGSLLYGPILSAFLIGMFLKRVGPHAVKIGVVAGILTNIYLWISTSISWLWWNFTEFRGSVIVAIVASIVLGYRRQENKVILTISDIKASSKIKWSHIYKLVLIYFFIIILISNLIVWIT